MTPIKYPPKTKKRVMLHHSTKGLCFGIYKNGLYEIEGDKKKHLPHEFIYWISEEEVINSINYVIA